MRDSEENSSRLTWYDRVVLLSKDGTDKIDLCLLSRNDFEEVRKQMHTEIPVWVAEKYDHGNHFTFNNCRFFKDETVEDGNPITFKKLPT